MKILLVSELHSSNLGDGLIAACVVRALERLGHRVTTLDLSGRSGIAAAQPRSGSSLFFLLKRVLPHWVRRLKQRVEWHIYRRRRCAHAYQSSLQGIELVLIGGGQLLADNNLDFPSKLNELHREIAKRGIPHVFLACGVGRFSNKARSLLSPCLRGAMRLTVRDAASIKKLGNAFPEIAERISVVLDPAVTVRELVGGDRRETNAKEARYGLGIIAKQKVELYQPSVARMTQQEYDQFWIACAAQLCERGETVLVSNGEPVDSRYAEDLQLQLADMGLPVLLELFETPLQLATEIGEFDAFVAARLHALICAVILGVPTMAVEWDDKVAGVMKEIGCQIPTLRIERIADGLLSEWISSAHGNDMHFLSDVAVSELTEEFRSQLAELLDQDSSGASNAAG